MDKTARTAAPMDQTVERLRRLAELREQRPRPRPRAAPVASEARRNRAEHQRLATADDAETNLHEVGSDEENLSDLSDDALEVDSHSGDGDEGRDSLSPCAPGGGGVSCSALAQHSPAEDAEAEAAAAAEAEAETNTEVDAAEADDEASPPPSRGGALPQAIPGSERKAKAAAEAAEEDGVSPRSMRGSSHSSSLAMSYVGSAAFSHLDIAHIRFGTPTTPEAAAAAAAAMAAEVEMDDETFALT